MARLAVLVACPPSLGQSERSLVLLLFLPRSPLLSIRPSERRPPFGLMPRFAWLFDMPGWSDLNSTTPTALRTHPSRPRVFQPRMPGEQCHPAATEQLLGVQHPGLFD